MRRVHILDPQLVGQGGHYLNHDAQLVRELQRRGIAVSLYARQGCSVSCEGLTPIPVFSFDIFKEAATDPHVWPMENFHAVNEAFLSDLARIDTTEFAADHLLYFPNLLQNELYAIALWLARLPSERRPKVAVMLRYLNHAMDYLQGRANRELIPLYYRFAASALAKVQPKSWLCADTRELATTYQKITGLPVLELPNPMDVSGLLAGATEPSVNPRPVVVYQGHTSPLRGFHFLADIVDACKKLNPKPRFIIQVQNREAAMAMKLGPVLDRLGQFSADDVSLVEGPLPAQQYFEMLQQADLVLLPYSPNFYGHGSSGVFTEAASLGKVIVVSEGTMPARQGREYRLGVVPAAKWTAPSTAEAVATALRRFPALHEQARLAAPKFRHENCARAFWDKLLPEVGM